MLYLGIYGCLTQTVLPHQLQFEIGLDGASAAHHRRGVLQFRTGENGVQTLDFAVIQVLQLHAYATGHIVALLLQHVGYHFRLAYLACQRAVGL